MEKDKVTGMLTEELGSYKVEEGAEYISKTFCQEDIVHIYFDTAKDVEDWEYSGIYDNFPEESFTENGFDIEFVDDEFNPTWLVKFDFMDDYADMESKIAKLCRLIKEGIEGSLEAIKGREEEYKEE
jgi:hypothetical protein